jgi:hypothetical protein
LASPFLLVKQPNGSVFVIPDNQSPLEIEPGELADPKYPPGRYDQQLNPVPPSDDPEDISDLWDYDHILQL